MRRQDGLWWEELEGRAYGKGKFQVRGCGVLGLPRVSDLPPPLTGFPNVGKSSLMNGLVGRKVVSVSRTPGHTKYFQTYFLTPTVRLCDCPGLIFPSLVDRQLQVLPHKWWGKGRRPSRLEWP